MRKHGILTKIVDKFEKKAETKSAETQNKTKWGKILFIFCFVAIPLPGTGGWTGALIAAMMDMRLKKAFPAITAGVLTAGLIVFLITYVLYLQ